MTMNRTTDIPAPAFVRSVIKLVCSGCGTETTAACNCGKPYVPQSQRAKEYAEANLEASVREIAEKTGVGHGTAQEAKSGVRGTVHLTTGRDGKHYRARRPHYFDPDFGLQPIQQELIDQAMAAVKLMNRRTMGRFVQSLNVVYRSAS
jgi:hypothetical protein